MTHVWQGRVETCHIVVTRSTRTVLEEQWLTRRSPHLLPLVQLFEGMLRTASAPARTVSLSAPLINMYRRFLKSATKARLDQLDRARREGNRPHQERAEYQRNAEDVHNRFQAPSLHVRCHERQLGARVPRLQDAGVLSDHVDCRRTPTFRTWTETGRPMRAQVHVAADLYEKHFGRRTQACGSGECGYVPGSTSCSARRASATSSSTPRHPLRRSAPALRRSTLRLFCPSGVGRVRPRHESSRQVWSAKEGYPGDPHYRDFLTGHRLRSPDDYIGPYVHPEGTPDGRPASIPRHHPTTSSTTSGHDHEAARRRAGDEHAMHFRTNRSAKLRDLRGAMDRPRCREPRTMPSLRHWWFEGCSSSTICFRQIT